MEGGVRSKIESDDRTCVLFLPFSANANDEATVIPEIYINEIIDTTSISPIEYDRALNSLQNTEDANSIQAICALFISSVYASRRNRDYSVNLFLEQNEALLDDSFAYLNSVNELCLQTNEICGYKYISDRLSFTDYSAVISGNHCEARVWIDYEYQLEGATEEDCHIGCWYYISLESQNKQWIITRIRTSLPTEQSDGFIYKGFTVEERPSKEYKCTVPSEAKNVGTENEKTGIMRSGLTRVSYAVSDAITYARSYYNTNNSLFTNNGNNDCQNFASQCVWAGLRAGCNTGANLTAQMRPAVSTSVVGSSAQNVWCNNQATTYYSNYQHNWAWDNVNGFFKLISSNNSTKEGPQGYYTTHSLAYVVAGDVLAWDTAGTCSVTSATLDHAMFVVSVSGSSGSRGIDDIYIAAHSPNTVSIRAPLRSYMAQCGLSTLTENNFAVAHINCGYYNLSN